MDLLGALTSLANPKTLLTAARNAARLELSVPVALLRWAIDKRPRGKGPTKIELFDADPALGIALNVDLYGTPIDVRAHVTVESIANVNGALAVNLRVRDLSVVAPEGTPAAMMLGSMDFSKPAALISMMPAKHGLIVSAVDDLFVLDLFKIKALRKNAQIQRVLGALSFVAVKHTRLEGELLAIGLDVSPFAIPAAIRRALRPTAE
jgi:hypothetical protein